MQRVSEPRSIGRICFTGPRIAKYCLAIWLAVVAAALANDQSIAHPQAAQTQGQAQKKVTVRFVTDPTAAKRKANEKQNDSSTDDPKKTTQKSAAADNLSDQKKSSATGQANNAIKQVQQPNDGKTSSAIRLSAGESENRSAVPKEQPTAKGPARKESTADEDLTQNKLRSQQAKDSGECPGGTDSTQGVDSSADDLPLEHTDHPFDAPVARTDFSSGNPGRIDLEQNRLTSQEDTVRTRINECLRYYLENPESVTRRSPWAVMHATLPFGVETELVAGNRRVNAIGWMCYNGLCKTQRMFQPTKSGFRTNIGPGVQGHEGQLLAILAQSHVSPRHPIRIGSANYTVFDLARLEMATCREKSELTFKLIGLSYYLDSDYRWRDNQGKTWSLEKIVAEELDQPIIGAACGGTHRLMGFSYSLAQRKYAMLPITGQWLRAGQFIDEFVNYALSLQNPDGSFSTEWFERRADEPNLEKKVQTTGHILEWLIFTVPEQQLKSEPIQRSINFLLDNISDNRQHNWPIGPRGHSLRALSLYNQRMFNAPPGNLREKLAKSKQEVELR